MSEEMELERKVESLAAELDVRAKRIDEINGELVSLRSMAGKTNDLVLKVQNQLEALALVVNDITKKLLRRLRR